MCMLPFPGRPYALARRPGRRAADGCRAPRGLFPWIICSSFTSPKKRPNASNDAARTTKSRRARPGSAFGQPNTDRRVRLVCLSSGPDPKADGLLERPGEAFCPAKFIKLGLEGLACSRDLALGAIAPVIDACRTRHQPRNPKARHHEARFQRRAEPRGRGFRTHRSPSKSDGSQIQKLYKRR